MALPVFSFGQTTPLSLGQTRVPIDEPMPINGRTSGACRGYVKDHIKPLACGGADAPNMQWQTKADGKAKDKWETKGCAR
jgi:hypothetical protein